MPCPPKSTCAHQASRYLAQYFSELKASAGTDMRNVGGMCRCLCGLVLRAKQLRDWASGKGNQVNSTTNQGVFLVYQQRNSDGQGHVYAKIYGSVCGNNLADGWNAWDIQQIFKLK